MTPKDIVEEIISFNTRGMKKAHKRIYSAFRKLNLNTMEAYIITRATVEDMEKEAKKA